MMSRSLQDGIYYLKNPKRGNACCVILLRAGNGSTASDVAEVLAQLWSMYKNLQRGVTTELKELNPRNLYSGNLTLLIGYGPELFRISGIKKQLPSDLTQHGTFKNPDRTGGGPIIEDSSLKYSCEIRRNHASSEHFLLQVIGDDEFITTRAVVETWKLLGGMKKNALGDDIIYINRIYTGFGRQDNRDWLGFHDGISNLTSKNRLQVIAINGVGVSTEDAWTVNGTYMGFLRIEVDLKKWSMIPRKIQEIIIGRDKITGCPLIGCDKNKNPIRDPRCPVRGTFEIFEPGNEMFREHPPFGKQRNLPSGISDKILENSHIGRANPIESQDKIFTKLGSYRIFRQGFEFFEPTDAFPGFRVGLDFISFQNSSKALFSILQRGFGSGNVGGIADEIPRLEEFLYVRAAGIFFVPPVSKDELFPGEDIFLTKKFDPRSKYSP